MSREFTYKNKVYTIVKTNNKWEIFNGEKRVENQKGLVRNILCEKYNDYTVTTSTIPNTHMAIQKLYEHETKQSVVDNKNVIKKPDKNKWINGMPKNGSRTVNLWKDSFEAFNDKTKSFFEKTSYLAYYLCGWGMANSLKNIKLSELVGLIEWLYSNQQLSTSKKYVEIRKWFQEKHGVNYSGKGILETKILLGTTGEMMGLDVRVKEYIKTHYRYIEFHEKWYNLKENELDDLFKRIQGTPLTNSEKEKLSKLEKENDVDNLHVREKMKDYFFWYYAPRIKK
jgi:hypothetical protein